MLSQPATTYILSGVHIHQAHSKMCTTSLRPVGVSLFDITRPRTAKHLEEFGRSLSAFFALIIASLYFAIARLHSVVPTHTQDTPSHRGHWGVLCNTPNNESTLFSIELACENAMEACSGWSREKNSRPFTRNGNADRGSILHPCR